METLPLFSRLRARSHEVGPGLSGWTQVNGHNRLALEERFALDIWHANRAAFRPDMRIILQAPISIVRRNGVSSEGHTTMHRVTGSPEKRRSIDTQTGAHP